MICFKYSSRILVNQIVGNLGAKKRNYRTQNIHFLVALCYIMNYIYNHKPTLFYLVQNLYIFKPQDSEDIFKKQPLFAGPLGLMQLYPHSRDFYGSCRQRGKLIFGMQIYFNPTRRNDKRGKSW